MIDMKVDTNQATIRKLMTYLNLITLVFSMFWFVNGILYACLILNLVFLGIAYLLKKFETQVSMLAGANKIAKSLTEMRT